MIQPKDWNAMVELKRFLSESEGRRSRPGERKSSVESLCDTLWDLRADSRFWFRLEALVGALDKSQLDLSGIRPSTLPNASVDALLSDLRSSLVHKKKTDEPWRGFLSKIGAAGLLGFLVLGTAACNDTCEEMAADDGIQHPEEFCDLVHIINNADIPWTVRVNLIDCLPGLGAAMRADYLARFMNDSDEELAEALKELSSSWECDDPEWEWPDGDSGH